MYLEFELYLDHLTYLHWQHQENRKVNNLNSIEADKPINPS